MQAGRLRHRLKLQSATETNSGGTVSRSWVTQATVWAAIEPLSGSVRYEAQQAEENVDTRIVIRYRDDVTSKWRGKDESDNIYNFRAVIDVNGRQRELQIDAVKDNG